jgi:hypothetical protein
MMSFHHISHLDIEYHGMEEGKPRAPALKVGILKSLLLYNDLIVAEVGMRGCGEAAWISKN